MRVWSFVGKPKNQLNGYGWIGESQVSQWIAASYIIPSQEGGFDLVVGTLPGPLSGACTGHLLKVCGVGSPVRSGDFGRLASSSLKRGMFGQGLHLVLLLWLVLEMCESRAWIRQGEMTRQCRIGPQSRNGLWGLTTPLVEG